MTEELDRQLPVGAEAIGPERVHFRVWAPRTRAVTVVIEGAPGPLELAPEGNGYFSGEGAAGVGALYRYSLDGAEPLPDPASRFQPQGPHGPSEVVDPRAYHWRDRGWNGPDLERPVIYELHVGTFTPGGTWCAAAAHLPYLAELGISLIELMPVAAFPGSFGWGYDGVDLFAPTQLYGRPDDLRAFVDAAHAAGIGVILDVVYNHFGPDGCYLREFTPDYFSRVHSTEWGDALNFDGPDSGPVREFFQANAGYWVREYHMDGLRLDATQSIFDHSERHIIGGVVAAVRAAAGGRRTYVAAENETQDTSLLRPQQQNGCGVDAAWNDDFHHTARVALTGRKDAYYSDYGGTPQELISAVRRGYLYQGQHYSWQKHRRGTPGLDLPASSFIRFLQNHDQVANSAQGRRIHELTSPGLLRALTALLLLAPGTPLLLQGQEFAAATPFLYFADHRRGLAQRVSTGRREFLSQFRTIDTAAVQAELPRPDARATFERCILDHESRAEPQHAAVLALHRDLIALARTPPFLHADRDTVEGAVLGAHTFLLRYRGEHQDDRLLLVNLGADLSLSPLPEPLLAPPGGERWSMAWSSEHPRYGGEGAPDDVEGAPAWHIPGWAAVVLRLAREDEDA